MLPLEPRRKFHPTVSPGSPLRRLHDLDRVSPQFHERLVDFLRGDDYRSAVQNLRNGDLVWLVEYLDNVSPQTISPHSEL